MKANKLLAAALVLSLCAAIYEMRRADALSQAMLAKPELEQATKDQGESTRLDSLQRPMQHVGVVPITVSAVVPVVSHRPSMPDAAKDLARKTEKHRRYDLLFRRLGLTPAESDQFIELLVEQDEARADLQAAVKDQNLAGDSAAVAALRSSLYAPIVRRMRDLLGNDGYDAYGAYDKNSYYRDGFISPMTTEFSAVAAPLSDAQFTQLTEVVAANDHPSQRASTDVGLESSIDWQTVLSQASAFLTPAQLDVVRARASRGHGG